MHDNRSSFSDSVARLPHGAALALIALSALLIYGSSLGYGFLLTWDDNYYITQNPLVRNLSLDNIATAFTAFRVGNYAPIHILSYMIDHSLWGHNPVGYRVVNLALHALNGCLLYLLTVRLHRSRYWALCAALVFIAHPVQVETVVWISERKTLLSLTFFLGALHAFISYRRCQSNRYPYLLALALYILACLTKSVVVVFPLVILLHDLIMTDRRPSAIILDKIPFFLIAAATARMAMLSQAVRETGGGISDLHGGTLSSHILTSLTTIPDYLVMLLWPVRLSALYTIRITTTPDPKVVASLLLMACAVGAGVFLYRRRSPLLFWYATAIICLLPVMQIVPLVTLRNDRYLYFPMIGISTLAGYCVDTIGRRSVRSRQLAVVLPLLVLVALAVGSHFRSRVWRDDVTLWQDATMKQPECAVAWGNLGEAYHYAGDLPADAAAYARSLELDGTNLLNLNNIVATYAEMGHYAQGVPYAERLLQLDPSSYVGHKNLGIALLEAGRKGEARAHLETALALRPGDPAVLQQLGRMAGIPASP